MFTKNTVGGQIMAKRGRPRTVEKYRHNIIRFGLLEDTLERILKELPPRSVKARQIVLNELQQLRLTEIRKVEHQKL